MKAVMRKGNRISAIKACYREARQLCVDLSPVTPAVERFSLTQTHTHTLTQPLSSTAVHFLHTSLFQCLRAWYTQTHTHTHRHTHSLLQIQAPGITDSKQIGLAVAYNLRLVFSSVRHFLQVIYREEVADVDWRTGDCAAVSCDKSSMDTVSRAGILREVQCLL